MQTARACSGLSAGGNARREKFPKNKKRLVTLASHEAPEQPSPRTARSQSMVSHLGCKFHVGASGRHETAIFYSAFSDFQKQDSRCSC